jgi:3-deoxy-D-arabino-heptulosonate 7-phosphate (DAHP) synthase
VSKFQPDGVAVLKLFDFIEKIPDGLFQFRVLCEGQLTFALFVTEPCSADNPQALIRYWLTALDPQILNATELVLGHYVDEPALSDGQIGRCKRRPR